MTTVLIVDDHPSFRDCARVLLEAEGFSVVGEAEDCASTLAAVEELRPDVILLDVQLPDCNGIELTPQLSANGYRPRVVLVSSRDRADYGSLVEESGAAGFIPKDELSGASLAALVP